MDFIHIGDVARANILAAQSDVTDAAFNVASGVETSLLELAEMLLNVMDSDLSVEFGPEPIGQQGRGVRQTRGHCTRTRAARLRGGDRTRTGADAAGRLWKAERAGAPAVPVRMLERIS